MDPKTLTQSAPPVSYGGELPVINDGPLPDVGGGVGRPSKGEELKAGLTVGRFTMARMWAVDRRDVAASAGRRQHSAGSGRRVLPSGGLVGPHGSTGKKARK
jgi:hypothetical protein